MLLLAQRSSQRPSSFGCFPCTPENIYRAFAVYQNVKAFYGFQAVLRLSTPSVSPGKLSTSSSSCPSSWHP